MRVGIVGDVHEPFTYPTYLNFCQDTFQAWRVDSIVFIGDIVDNHAISFWDHDPNGLSAESEAERASVGLARWRKAFRKAKVCIGNHDERHYRTARKAGLPDRFIRSYSDVWDTPQWNWQMEHVLDDVFYFHGSGRSGKDAAFNEAVQRRMSIGMGHIHGFAGVKYHTNPTSKIFGINVGCGVDCKAYAFAYGKEAVTRPVLGCGIVIDGERAFFEPMAIGRGAKYDRSRAGKRQR
jgi:predicted phosphodiesterase